MESAALILVKLLMVYCCLAKHEAQVIVKKSSTEYVFKPFEFAYHSNDGMGTTQHREEMGDETGKVKGKYEFMDPYGMRRSVEYVADDDGFRAVVKTNEPGTANQNTADVVWMVEPPPDIIIQANALNVPKRLPRPARRFSSNFTTGDSIITGISNATYQLHSGEMQYPMTLARQASVEGPKNEIILSKVTKMLPIPYYTFYMKHGDDVRKMTTNLI